MSVYSEAMQEAYASSPIDEQVLITLEMHHPTFINDIGERTAIRVVRAFEDHDLRLENTAPLNAGQIVTFQKCSFELTEPGYEEGKVPTLPIAIDGVSREITGYLEQAIVSLVPITVYFRPYLLSDPSGPGLDPPYRFTLTDVTVDIFRVSGQCNLNDVHNWPFPANKYTRERFPGLAR